MAKEYTRGKEPAGMKPGAVLTPALARAADHPRSAWILAGVHFAVLLFIGLRYHIVGDYGVETDFFWSYVPSARDVLSGVITIENFRGPVYPILLAFVNLVVGNFFSSGMLLSTIAASVTVAVTFLLLRLCIRSDAALFGAVIVASTPFFVQYSYTAGTDMVFTALLVSGAYLLLRGEQPRRLDLILSGVLFALAYLTRYNGIFVAVAVPAVFVLANPYVQTVKDRIMTAAIPVAAFFIVIAPWGIYCLIERGSFFYSLNHLNIAYEMFAKGTVSWDTYWGTAQNTYSSLAAVVLADPGRFLGRVIVNAYEHGASDLTSLLGWIIGIPALLGIVFLLRDRPGRRIAALYLFFALDYCILLLVFYGERFSLSLLPAYALAMLWFVNTPKIRSIRLWKTVPLSGVLLIVVLGVTVQRSYAYNDQVIASGPTELIEISRWVERNVPQTGGERPVVVARKPHAGYYLNMRWEYFPGVQTYPELLAELRKMHASYLLFGLMEAGMRPQFQYLLDPQKAPPELVPLVYTYSPPAVLYKVELPPE